MWRASTTAHMENQRATLGCWLSLSTLSPLGVSSCYTVAQVLIVLNENLESDIRGLHKETLP